MCKDSIKKLQGFALFALMAVMIYLVASILDIIVSNSEKNDDYREKFNAYIETVINHPQEGKEESIVAASNLNDTTSYMLIEKDYLKEILRRHVTDHSSIMDANNYLAIILTLITLCVTLAAVIPYIMGKSILEKDIKDAVEEIHESETVKYQKLVDQLERSEAHLSRMSAYNLLTEYKLDLNKCNACGKRVDLNLRLHPYWVIGWASKAITRYLKCSSRGFATDEFIKNCVEYITEAATLTDSIAIDDKKGVIVRAFTDLFDAMQMGKNKDLRKFKHELDAILYKLWNILKECDCYKKQGDDVECVIFIKVKSKSKYVEYLDEGPKSTEKDFHRTFYNWKDNMLFSHEK